MSDVNAGPTNAPAVLDYLRRLDQAAAGLPTARRAELVADVAEHIAAALRADGAVPSEAVVRNVLNRLGDPDEIVRAEGGQPAPMVAAAAPGHPSATRDAIAVVLLLFGGFLLGFGWLIGVTLLWISPSWRIREKLLGTFVWPLGYLGVLPLGGIPAYSEACTQVGNVDGVISTTCTGGSPFPSWVGILLVVVVLAAPAVMAATLWNRRQAVSPK